MIDVFMPVTILYNLILCFLVYGSWQAESDGCKQNLIQTETGEKSINFRILNLCVPWTNIFQNCMSQEKICFQVPMIQSTGLYQCKN